MSSLGHTIRSFNRFELKYVITLKQAQQFKTSLAPFVLPDDHGSQNGRYALANLYYDSPDFRCYHEKEAGLLDRRKLRIRRYENGEVLSDEAPVFVEIKQRIDRITQKRRAVLPYRQALRLCNDRQIPEHEARDQATLEEIYTFLWQYNLRPACIVRYNRQAFMGSLFDVGLRITFDTALTYQTHQLHLHEPASSLPLLPAHQVVMEIKINERMPSWLTELVASHNLQVERVSKYCRSIEAAQRWSTGLWRSPILESSHQVLASSYSVYQPIQRKMEIEK